MTDSNDSKNTNGSNNGAPAAPAPPAHLDPIAVSQETDRLAQQVADDLGIDPKTLTEAQRDKLMQRAKVNLVARSAQVDSRAETERLKTENAGLAATANTLRQLRSTDSRDYRPAITCDQAERAVGALAWRHQMLPEQRIAQLGVDPKSVDYTQLNQLFGKNSDAGYANKFAMQQPGKYRVLREIARATKLIG